MLMSIFLFIFQLLDAMGPLSKVWATAECAKNSQDKQVEVSLGYMLRYLDQTVVLLGQAYHNISYTLRFHVLKQITGDPRKTKKVLKEKRETFESENHYLFGEKFETDLVKTAKSNQKAREVLTTMGNKQLFRKSPLSQTYQPNKGRRQNTRLLLTKSGSKQTGRRDQQSGYRCKDVCNDKQVKQHFLEVPPRFQKGESTSSGESTVSNIFSSSGPTYRKAKSVLFKLVKTNKIQIF